VSASSASASAPSPASSAAASAALSASASHLDEHNACGLLVDPRSGLLLLGGLPGQLQLFDAARDRHVAELPVVARQFVSRMESSNAASSASASGSGNGSGSERAIVQHAAIHGGGDWLATIESRPMRARAGNASSLASVLAPSSSASALLPIASEADDGVEAMVLKFWRYDRESNAHAPVAADPSSSSSSSSSGPLSGTDEEIISLTVSNASIIMHFDHTQEIFSCRLFAIFLFYTQALSQHLFSSRSLSTAI
jgi:hypothetical protein